MRIRNQQRPRHRGLLTNRAGSVLVAFLVVISVLSVIVASVSVLGARQQQLSSMSVLGSQARAAEGAAQMGIKELVDGVDHDGDGGIGSISNDSNTGTDPVLDTTRMWATTSTSGSVTTLTARAQGDQVQAAVEVLVEETTNPPGVGGDELFFGRDSTDAIRLSAFDSGTSTWGSASTSDSTSATPIWVSAVRWARPSWSRRPSRATRWSRA